jgi:hypothetical protein
MGLIAAGHQAGSVERTAFDVFKIVMEMTVPTGPKGKSTSRRISTYYFAPQIKAVVSFQDDGPANVTSALIDFNLAK